MAGYPIIALFVWFTLLFFLVRIMYDPGNARGLIDNFLIRTFIIFGVAFTTLYYIANYPLVFSIAMAFNFTFMYTAWNYFSAMELAEREYNRLYQEALAARIRRNQPPIWQSFMNATRSWHPDAGGPLWLPVPTDTRGVYQPGDPL